MRSYKSQSPTNRVLEEEEERERKPKRRKMRGWEAPSKYKQKKMRIREKNKIVVLDVIHVLRFFQLLVRICDKKLITRETFFILSSETRDSADTSKGRGVR